MGDERRVESTISKVREKRASVTARSRLRQALSEQLVPVLLDSGFAGPATISGNSLLREYRRTTGTGVQVLTIQLEKNQLPRGRPDEGELARGEARAISRVAMNYSAVATTQ